MATNKNIIKLKEQTAALCVSVPNDKGENRIFTSQVQTVNAPQAEENAENPRSKESDNLSNITHNNAESTSNPNGINRNGNNLFTQEKINGILENNTYEKQNSQTDEYENPKQWFTNELLAEVDDQSEPTIAGYIVAPSIVVQRLECKIISSMSPLIVSDAEELVSNIISIKCADTRIKVPFPVTISIPFCTRYRGSYRDIIVKVMDDKLQTCYLNPISLEGIYGGQKGSFAEVRVYKLGVFAVVSCLRKEIFTIPKKGILIKLNVDSRISFNYQPGSFNSPVIVQTKVQPIDTLLFSIIKSRQEVFHAIVSTSPLVYILHPSTQPFKKPITVTVPCPPNPDKRKQRDELDHSRPATAAVPNVTSTQQIRVSSASVRKHGDTAKETLKLLGYKAKEELWTVMEANVRNLQNGLITFDISEHLERLIVFRLSISIDASHLIQFVEELEKGTYNTMVKVIIYRKKDEINSAVLLVVPSKDLNFELANLREEGYIGPPEPSESISVQEGDQLILHFSGNISAYDSGHEALQGKRFTFHLQRKLRLVLYLRVNDEFGNYSSPHYKGTALLYKLSRNTAAKFWDKSIYPNDYQQNTPVCKLALTLPKRERIVNRPSSAKSISSDSTDPLSETVLYWLSEELSEEDAALLVISLRIRRSAIQIVKLKIPDNLTEQIFELLLIWRKSLPASANKTRLLSHHLCKCGRDDLAEELKSKSENI
ncbi:death domain-containing protein 1 [Protopterus annectens]|uniref:death domain-containing protein 1 n=1 Tax=Protopterus annectens TaxID=7888 RepID=UPI001CFBD610|nr:death domain-containing protein 1 [Protopterus annectens]